MNEFLNNGAGRAKTLNLLGPALALSQRKPVITDPNVRLTVAKDCGARFWSQVAVSVEIACNYFYEIYDICEERKMLRFNQGKWLEKTKECFDKYKAWIQSGRKNVAPLVADYAIQMDKLSWRQKRDLYLTFKVYYDKLGLQDTEFRAKVTTCMEYIHLAVDLFDGFFDTYRDGYGVDIREDYKAARIKDADMNFERFAVSVVKSKKVNVEPAKNYASFRAYEALIDKLLDLKAMDKAGKVALELNHEDETLAKIEREDMKLDRLQEKFKVTKA